ncbi:MAG: hypothetical protein ABR567_06065 [Myxococcales bacterium]
MTAARAALSILSLLLFSIRPVQGAEEQPKAFTFHLPQATLDRIRSQVADHRWLPQGAVEPWKYGIESARPFDPDLAW